MSMSTRGPVVVIVVVVVVVVSWCRIKLALSSSGARGMVVRVTVSCRWFPSGPVVYRLLTMIGVSSNARSPRSERETRW